MKDILDNYVTFVKSLKVATESIDYCGICTHSTLTEESQGIEEPCVRCSHNYQDLWKPRKQTIYEYELHGCDDCDYMDKDPYHDEDRIYCGEHNVFLDEPTTCPDWREFDETWRD